MSLFAFILLIGPLITIHELGHFIVAKLTGVRVLVFSLGFGPRLFGFKIGDTDYRLSALPLGGYVRMYGDESQPDVPENERHYAFLDKPWWVKVAIAVAGPAANLILPLFLFFGLAVGERQEVLPVVGTVVAGEPAAAAGVRPGDVVTRVDGSDVATFDDLVDAVAVRAGKATDLVVTRDGKEVVLHVTPSSTPSVEPGDDTPVGRIGLTASKPLPIVAVAAGSAAAAAGLKDGDLVKSVDGRDVDDRAALFAALDAAPADSDVVVVVERAAAPAKDAKAPPPQDAKETLTLTIKGAPKPLPPPTTIVCITAPCEPAQEPVPEAQPTPPAPPAVSDLRFAVLSDELQGAVQERRDATRAAVAAAVAEQARRRGLASLEGDIAAVEADSPAAAKGLKANAVRVVAVDGKPLQLASDVSVALAKDPDAIHVVGLVDDDGAGAVFTLRLQSSPRRELAGRKVAGISVATTLGGAVTRSRTVGVAEAAREAVENTGDTIVAIAHGFKLLATGKVGVEQLGGPVMIADVAGKAAGAGAEVFIGFMCLFSVNLGLLNLLPVPVLDGGHIVIVLFEAARRKKLDTATRNRVTQVGLVLVALLMFVALFNDVTSLF